MNEVEMKNEPLQERFELFSNPQIESNRTSQIEKQKTKKNSWTTTCWKKNIETPYKNSLCWSFYCINDNAKVDNKYP